MLLFIVFLSFLQIHKHFMKVSADLDLIGNF